MIRLLAASGLGGLSAMRALLLAVAACGGGASIDAQPSAFIVSSSCNLTSPTSFDANFEYMVSLQIGQAITPEIGFFSDPNDPLGSTSEFLGCGGWRPLGADTCVRDAGQPSTVMIAHSYAQDVGNSMLPIPTTLFVNANPLDAPGSFSIGIGDSEEINCQ